MSKDKSKRRFDVGAYLDSKISENLPKLLPPVEDPYKLPDSCPSYQIWYESYRVHNPMLYLRGELEKHISDCVFCKPRHEANLEMTKELEKDLCKDKDCKTHHP